MQHRRLQRPQLPRLWLLPLRQHCLPWISGFGLSLLLWLCFLNLWDGLGSELSDHVLRLAFPEWKFLWEQMVKGKKMYLLKMLAQSSFDWESWLLGCFFFSFFLFGERVSRCNSGWS
jgi:hypothetical protein